MKKMIYMVMALASLSYSTQTMAQSLGLQKKVNAYFLQSLKAQQKALEKDGSSQENSHEDTDGLHEILFDKSEDKGNESRNEEYLDNRIAILIQIQFP